MFTVSVITSSTSALDTIASLAPSKRSGIEQTQVFIEKNKWNKIPKYWFHKVRSDILNRNTPFQNFIYKSSLQSILSFPGRGGRQKVYGTGLHYEQPPLSNRESLQLREEYCTQEPAPSMVRGPR